MDAQSRLPVQPFEIRYNAVNLYQSDVVIDSADDGFRVRLVSRIESS